MPSPQTIDAAALYISTFTGRDDAYSVWIGDTWSVAYVDPYATPRVWEPLTPHVVLKAFATKVPISGYILGTNSYTHVAALDIDREDGMALGKLFCARLNNLGGICYLEASRRGCHVWIVLDAPRPGVLIRRALHAIIKEAGFGDCPGSGQRAVIGKQTRPQCPVCHGATDEDVLLRHFDPRIELRPGSDRLSGPEALGHCLRMPTMPHPKTLSRYVLTSSDGYKVPSKLAEMMLEINHTPASIFNDAADRAPLPPAAAPPSGLRYPFGIPKGQESASEILRTLWGALDAQPGHLIHCPAHDDQRPSLSILRDDQRVICRGNCELNNDGHGRGTYELRTMAPSAGGPR